MRQSKSGDWRILARDVHLRQIVDVLNGDREATRLTLLQRERLSRLARMVVKVSAESRKVDVLDTSALSEVETKFRTEIGYMNREISDFRWSPMFYVGGSTGLSAGRTLDSPNLEKLVVMSIYNAVERDEIERLRRCSYCKKWFVAGRTDKQFCDRKCRQSTYQKKPETKKLRARYHAERLERELKGIGMKTKANAPNKGA